MATKIKALKCPQCGSVSYSEIAPDRYRCQSCGTTYFLDNDDIRIIHRHETPPAAPAPSSHRLLALFGILCVVGIVVIALFAILRPAHQVNKVVVVNRSASAAKLHTPSEELTYRWRGAADQGLFFDRARRPYLFTIGTIASNDKKIIDRQLYVSIVDALTRQAVTLTPLDPEVTQRISLPSVRLRTWDNGDVMLLIADKYLYRLDSEQKIFVRQGDAFFANHADFLAGVAKIEFVSEQLGSGLLIYTNEGKQRYFYPQLDKVYSKEAFNKAIFGFDSVPKNTPARTAFIFTQRGSDYEEEPIQLIRYQHKNPDNYPRRSTSFRWQKDYVRYGLISENTPYKKVLINKWNQNGDRVVAYKDFTPGRGYFSPEVLGYNDKAVFIAFRAAPMSDNPLSLQLLDATDGKILWTHASDMYSLIRVNALMGDGVYLFQNSGGTLVLDGSGNKVNDFDTSTVFRPTKGVNANGD